MMAETMLEPLATNPAHHKNESLREECAKSLNPSKGKLPSLPQASHLAVITCLLGPMCHWRSFGPKQAQTFPKRQSSTKRKACGQLTKGSKWERQDSYSSKSHPQV